MIHQIICIFWLLGLVQQILIESLKSLIFVVDVLFLWTKSILFAESSTDRNCAGCQTCCLDYQCWLKMQDVLYAVINDTFFDVIVTLCIILNTVFLAIEHHGMSEDLQYILDLGNKVNFFFDVLQLGLIWFEVQFYFIWENVVYIIWNWFVTSIIFLLLHKLTMLLQICHKTTQTHNR